MNYRILILMAHGALLNSLVCASQKPCPTQDQKISCEATLDTILVPNPFNNDIWSIITQYCGARGISSKLWARGLQPQKALLSLSDAISPDATKRAFIVNRTIQVWDNTKKLYTLPGHTNHIDTVSFSPNGTQIMTATWDGIARVWNSATGTLLFALQDEHDTIFTATFSPDNKIIITAGEKRVIFWDAIQGKFLGILRNPHSHWSPNWSARFNKDGTHLVTGSTHNAVCIWDAHSQKLLHELKGHTSTINSVHYGLDGTITSTSHDGTARIWNLKNGKEPHKLEADPDYVDVAKGNADQTAMITIGRKGNPMLWDPTSGKQLGVLQSGGSGIRSAHFSSNGNELYTKNGHGLTLSWKSLCDAQPFSAKQASLIWLLDKYHIKEKKPSILESLIEMCTNSQKIVQIQEISLQEIARAEKLPLHILQEAFNSFKPALRTLIQDVYGLHDTIHPAAAK